MAHIADHLDAPISFGQQPGWLTRASNVFKQWKENIERRRWAKQMLSYDDRLLKDIGMTREDLIQIVGYDPRLHSTVIDAQRDSILGLHTYR